MSEKSPVNLPALDTHMGYQLRRISNHVSMAFARALQARQVSVSEWIVLRHIYDRDGITPGELAELLGMTRGAISKLVDKLEGKTWLTRSVKEEDNRVQLLTLTAAGVRIVPELSHIADANEEAFFSCLSVSERSDLNCLLQRLTQLHGWDDTPLIEWR